MHDGLLDITEEGIASVDDVVLDEQQIDDSVEYDLLDGEDIDARYDSFIGAADAPEEAKAKRAGAGRPRPVPADSGDQDAPGTLSAETAAKESSATGPSAHSAASRASVKKGAYKKRAEQSGVNAEADSFDVTEAVSDDVESVSSITLSERGKLRLSVAAHAFRKEMRSLGDDDDDKPAAIADDAVDTGWKGTELARARSRSRGRAPKGSSGRDSRFGLKRIQKKRNLRTSRKVFEKSLASPAFPGGVAAKALQTIRQVIAAVAAAVASLLLPLIAALVPLFLAASVILILFMFIFVSFGAYKPEPNMGRSVAAQALAQYQAGLDAGDSQHGEPKYWNYVFGGGFSDGYTTPWCACFVSWCGNEAGCVEGGIVPVLGGCGGYLGWYGGHPELGSIHHGFAGYTPRPGDFIIYNSTGGPGVGHDHIGIIVEVYEDGSFDTVEGNTYAEHTSICGRGDNHTGLHYHKKVGSVWPDTDRTGNGRGGGEPTFVRPAYPTYSYGEISIPEYSSGVCPAGHTYTDNRVGTYGTREWDLATNDFAGGTAQSRVEALWEAAGSVTDNKGFNTLDGMYLIACTSVFGQVGDQITFYFDDGSSIECVKIDAKAEAVAGHDSHPATKWGHNHDANVLEFCGSAAIGSNPYVALGLTECRVVSATNHGSIF